MCPLCSVALYIFFLLALSSSTISSTISFPSFSPVNFAIVAFAFSFNIFIISLAGFASPDDGAEEDGDDVGADTADTALVGFVGAFVAVLVGLVFVVFVAGALGVVFGATAFFGVDVAATSRLLSSTIRSIILLTSIVEGSVGSGGGTPSGRDIGMFLIGTPSGRDIGMFLIGLDVGTYAVETCAGGGTPDECACAGGGTPNE